MRGLKTTKEIGEEELSRLTKPEERSTTALDPTELAKLVDRSAKTRSPTVPPETRARTEDDLAIPVEGTPPPGPLPATPTPAAPVVADAAPSGRAHAPSWSEPTKESAVIVSTPPEADPPPAPESAPTPRTRSRGHVQRISTPSLGVALVDAPVGHRALTKPPEMTEPAPRPDETPSRMPRGSTRQATLDEVASMRSANTYSLRIAIGLAAACALLAVVYLLLR